jgi:hypothetical protein
MNRIYNVALALVLIFSCQILFAQAPIKQINIISFNVKNTLPADVSTWGSIPASLILVAQKMPQVNLQGAKLVVQIKQNGARICGTGVDAAPTLDINAARNFNANELVGYLSQCPNLKAGRYTICVQFFNIDRYPISEERCKEFMVEDAVQVQQSYTSPQNISPINDKKFAEKDINSPITFRWTPLVPRPKESVTYRLRVWQLMQGQNGSAAMRSNQPIVEKDVNNITQAIVTGIITGPCKPPYLCDFVWNVQALDKEGKALGNNNGTSELSSWSFTATQTNTLKLLLPENKSVITAIENAPINFRWTPLVPKPQQPVTYRLRVWQLMQGQNGSAAMRTNKPIIVKDMGDISEATISNIYTGPCKPPYLCDYVWSVEAMDNEGKEIVSSDIATFKIGSSTSTASTCPGSWSSIQCGPTAALGTILPPVSGLIPTMAAGTNLFINTCYVFPSVCTSPSIVYELHDATTNALINSASGINCGTTAFPILSTTPAGAYIFKIFAYCSTSAPSIICDSSRYQITITPASCCTGGSWGSNTWGLTASPTTPLPVSAVITTGAATNIYFNANYICATGCLATITYNFYGTSSSLLSSVTYPAGITPAIPIPSTAIYFKVIANCGTQSCDSIINKIIVTPCCAGSSWGTKIYRPAPLPSVPWQPLPCSSTLLPMHVSSFTKFKVSYNCAPGCGPAKICYTITGPGSYSWTTCVPSGTNVSAPMPPTVGGSLLTVQAYCGGALCNTCIDKLNIVP